MPGNALVNLGDISKPASVLIEKISDAVGGVFRPLQIRRIAQAEADAERIRALAAIEISEVQRRALERFVAEETKKQDNIESITAKALPNLKGDSRPENVEDDWITNFFDKCRLISNEQMQEVWAKVLAGEANSPGTFSRRTVDYLGSLDKADAELFSKLCSFGLFIGLVRPLIYDIKSDIYSAAGLTFAGLKHLDDIGLASFNPITGFFLERLRKHVRVHYYGVPIDVEFPNESDNKLDIGHVLLTKVGLELAPICQSRPLPEFLDHVLGAWLEKGLITSSPLRMPSTA